MSTTTEEPPPYSSNMAATVTFGFPIGYFTIRSLANGRQLDIEKGGLEDGTEAILWPGTDSSLVEGFRRPESDNQVFFIDPSGALCSKSAGHAIDVEDGQLVIRHRRPITQPYPNEYSHPLPQFSFEAETGEIHISFSSDPSYPLPSSSPSRSAWQDKTYVLSALPLRKPRTLVDDAADFFAATISNPLSGLFGASAVPASAATVEEVFNSDIDLREDEVVEEDRGEGDEVDDSPERIRKVVVLAVTVDENSRLTEKARLRRQWQVTPLRKSKVQRFTSGLGREL